MWVRNAGNKNDVITKACNLFIVTKIHTSHAQCSLEGEVNVLGEKQLWWLFIQPLCHQNQQKTGYTSLKSHDCQVTRPHSTPYNGDPIERGRGGERDGQK